MDSEINKIVIIIPHRGIGDVIFHIPLLRSLFKTYKNKLIIISNEVNHSKEILKNEIFYKKIINFNFTRGSISNYIRSSFKLFNIINSEKCDLLISTDPSSRIAIPILLSNSKKKIICGIKSIVELFLKKRTFRRNFLSTNLLELKKKLQLKNYYSEYSLKIKKTKYNYKKNKKKKLNLFFNIDSHHNHNNWGVKNFEYLLLKCIKYCSIVYINFSPKNRKIQSEFSSLIKNKKKIIFTYKKNISNIIKLINNSHAVIGNESGPICIGASLNKKVYSLYSKNFSKPESKSISKKIKYYIFNKKNNNLITKKITKEIRQLFEQNKLNFRSIT